MAQYPNYLNQPFQQPNNYMPYYQPMPIDRMTQLQQFQQSLQSQNQFGLPGKVVESIDIVKTMDIPMDGNLYYFPKADGTEIYAKQWMANGQTRILTFKPISEDGVANSTQTEEKTNLGTIDEFTEVLESKLNELYKKITDSKKKKEVVADE